MASPSADVTRGRSARRARPSRGGGSVHLCLALSIGLGSAAAAAAEPAGPCVPTARLDGDAALVAPIRASLQARAVPAGEQQTCERLAVQVMAAHPGYDLFITDAEGRTDRRQLVGPDTAAMVIESWLQGDLSEPLLRRAVAGAGVTDATTDAKAEGAIDGGAPGEAAVLSTRVAPAAQRTRRYLPAGSLWGLGAETSLDRGAALWWGASAGACFRIGRLCAGPQGRLRISPGPEASMPVTPMDLRSFDLGLAVEAPLSFGRWRLSPGLNLGAGRVTGRWRHNGGAADMLSTGRSRDNDGDGDSSGRGRDGRRDGDGQARSAPGAAPAAAVTTAGGSFASFGARASASLAMGVAIGAGVALELQVMAGARPVLRPPGESGGGPLAASSYVGHAGAGLALRYGQF